MKKILIIMMAAAMTVLFSACGVDVGGTSSQASASSSKAAAASSAVIVSQDSVEDSLSGLQKYLVASASVTGTPENMRADMIGAKSGVRYKYGYGGGKDNVMLELYEFDPSNLNTTAQKILSDVKTGGSFTLMDSKVNGVLSDSGKYLMIYKNASNDEKNKAYSDQIKKLFTEFKK